VEGGIADETLKKNKVGTIFLKEAIKHKKKEHSRQRMTRKKCSLQES
jgi:hypothetical protein